MDTRRWSANFYGHASLQNARFCIIFVSYFESTPSAEAM